MDLNYLQKTGIQAVFLRENKRYHKARIFFESSCS